MKRKKTVEIRDARINFVSLVERAANRRPFLITKSEGGQARFSALCPILKADGAAHYVTGIVYEPHAEDAHGHSMTGAEIRKAAHWFAKHGDKADLRHSFEPADGVSVVESYIAPSDMNIGGTLVSKDTWILTAEVKNPDIWDKVQKDEITGFSMGGTGAYVETDAPGGAEEAGPLPAEEAARAGEPAGFAAEPPVTRASVEAMVAQAVAAAMLPVLKSRGLLSNLDGAPGDAKPPAGTHYLGGIL